MRHMVWNREAIQAYCSQGTSRTSGQTEEGSLPELDNPFGGEFDGILCSAVLMHVSRESLFDCAFSFKRLLREGGRLLLSVPKERPDINGSSRDTHGRLFEELPANYLQLLFERLGFREIGRWNTVDSIGRQGYTWLTLLYTLENFEPPATSIRLKVSSQRTRRLRHISWPSSGHYARSQSMSPALQPGYTAMKLGSH